MDFCSKCSLLLAVILTAAAILFMLSQRVRYYAKFIIYLGGSLVAATIPIPLMLMRPRDYRNAYIPAWGCRWISRFIGVTWEIRGQENIIRDAGGVVVINHQSSLDLIVLAQLWPVVGRCTVISKYEVFFLWPFGLASYLWGTLFINRSNSKGARESVNITARAINEKHAKLCMFPEGTRHHGPELMPFRKGAFHVAISSQCPIQPVVVSRYYFLDNEQKIFDNGHNIISILPPIPTKGLTLDDMTDLIQRTHDIMSQEYKTISAEALRIRSQMSIKSH